MKKNSENCSTEKVQTDKQQSVSRRKFMKKAAYTAPKIIALGLLAQGKPSGAFDGPPNAPGNSGQPW